MKKFCHTRRKICTVTIASIAIALFPGVVFPAFSEDLSQDTPSIEAITEDNQHLQEADEETSTQELQLPQENSDSQDISDEEYDEEYSIEEFPTQELQNATEDDSEPEGYTIQEPQRKALDLEGVDQALTQRYITQYQSNTNRQWLVQCLNASIPYRPYIRQKLIENDMPLVLQYLPIVESNYKINAVSKAGATGMWQFMENSMSPFLKKNTWYDERLDPWKATDAAIAKLKDNYRMFGNWIDAIAAYNCGAGAMTRTLKANPGKDFWYLAEHGILREQTALYVPKLLAIAELVENAEYYGLLEIGIADKIIEDTEPEEYDYVTIAGMLSLNQISQITEIDRETLGFLNPCLLKNCTPAGEKWELRLPSGTKEAAEAALKANSIPTDAVIHIVKQGDSLWAISRKYGLTVNDLCLVNGIKESSILSIGQKIIIPIFN